MRPFFLATALALLTTPLMAQDVITYTTDESFDDVIFGLENAILDEGLLVDGMSHVGDMLERTRADIGSDITIFLNADVYSFCSAVLSRQVMEVNPLNVRFCPYDIFVMQLPESPDQTTIGYRSYPEGEMKIIEGLLDRIAKSAIGLD